MEGAFHNFQKKERKKEETIEEVCIKRRELINRATTTKNQSLPNESKSKTGSDSSADIFFKFHLFSMETIESFAKIRIKFFIFIDC